MGKHDFDDQDGSKLDKIFYVSDCQEFTALIEINTFLNELFISSSRLSKETILEEIKPVVTATKKSEDGAELILFSLFFHFYTIRFLMPGNSLKTFEF